MNIKKKSVALLLSATLVISAVTAGIIAFANASVYSYDSENKVLTIKADTDNYTQENYTNAPWNKYNNEVEKIIVQEGVNSIGDFSFCFESALTSVTLPSTLTNIGTAAFAGSDTLKELTVPDSVTSFGDYAFGYNSQMMLTDGFVAKCSQGSYAQGYCLANYIMFDSPIENGVNSAVINKANEQCIWSFAPKTNCIISFSSETTDDTYGLIYDAATYTYSDSFDIMKDSAIVDNDDGNASNNENLNFSISYDLEAGKRYYLCAKFKNPSETGEFKVDFSSVCKEHIYEENVIKQPSCETDGKSEFTCIACGDSYFVKLYATGHSYSLKSFDGENANIQCEKCDSTYSIRFSDYYHKQNILLDVVRDGIINAKDYAELYNEYRIQN